MRPIEYTATPPQGARRPISCAEAEKLLPKACEGEMDPRFPPRGSTCDPEFIRNVLKAHWALRQAIKKRLVGQESMIYWLILAFFAYGERQPKNLGFGHLLLTGHPGSGKTVLAETLRELYTMKTSRIQGGPDTMFSDITGSYVLHIDENGKRGFKFVPGAIFGDFVNVDEITRITPRVQSAFLEVMSEGTVTDSNGITHKNPAFILGTSNDEHVWKLLDALYDRFMLTVRVELPTAEDFTEILYRTQDFHKVKLEPVGTADDVMKIRKFFHEAVTVSPEIRELMGRVTRTIDTIDGGGLLHDLRAILQLSESDEFLQPGSVPLSGRSLPVWEGISRSKAAMEYRDYVTLGDIKQTLLPVVRHRLHFKPNVISQDARECVQSKLRTRFQGTGKTEMAEYLTQEIIRVAWDHAGLRKV